MRLEDRLKEYIKGEYRSLRNFCNTYNLPYSTIDNMFKRGLSGSSIDKVISLCSALDIDLDELAENGRIVKKSSMAKYLSEHERVVIEAYRSHPDVQPHVDKLLDIWIEEGNKK
jgi:hypothetical protein